MAAEVTRDATKHEATPAAGWQSVVTVLVTERGDALTRYAWLISGSADEAADLVQDALVKTFGRLRNGFTVCTGEDDAAGSFRSDLPHVSPSAYEVSAAIDLTRENPDGTFLSTDLVTGPTAEVTLR